MPQQKHIHQLLTLANHYPSPHNGQPIRLQLTETGFALFFDRARGLQAADVSPLFSFVSMGVFVEHFQLVAQAFGHTLTVKENLPNRKDLIGEGLVPFASAAIDWNAGTADQDLYNALRRRQTSRKKYTKGPDSDTVEMIQQTFESAGMQLHQLSKQQSDEAIWLNQRAVFDDLFDTPVQKELDHWLRYTQKEKERYRDGLSYDAMEINGTLLKIIVRHPFILRLPGVGALLKAYYTRTMRDESSVLYVQAPFLTEQDSYAVGVQIMKAWKVITERGYYLHPFGTVMANVQAHADFLEIAGIKNESIHSSYLVFIFKLGKSDPPVRSLRIPYEKQLLLEKEHE